MTSDLGKVTTNGDAMIICLPNLIKKLEIFNHSDFNIDSNVVYVP